MFVCIRFSVMVVTCKIFADSDDAPVMRELKKLKNSFMNPDTRRAQRNYNIRSFKLVGPFIFAGFPCPILPVIIILVFFTLVTLV